MIYKYISHKYIYSRIAAKYMYAVHVYNTLGITP